MDKDDKINEVSITKITIKKENVNDNIKEFAETAMNELLGWYGYGPREDVARNSTSRTCRSHSESNSSSPESPKFSEVCGWCSKHVEENTALCTSGAVFCSELCFAQSRRATFKKSKTCDWCRHVRHTVSYVDFHDGASQLQFCSDKCLNQYKMHIFCRETQAHLEMHPHLPIEDSSSGTLITPDLWMKNCKSPGTNSTSPPLTPPISLSNAETQPPQTSPLPLITVAHPSKLMALPRGSPDIINKNRQSRKLAKRNRKRCPSTITASMNKSLISDLPQDLRVRTTPNHFDQPRIPPPVIGSLENEPMETDHNPLETRRDYPNFSHSSPPSRRTSVSNTKKDQANSQDSNSLATSPERKHLSLLPPPTILVPYPIVLPVPVPIPIPIPLLNFLPKSNNSNCNTGNLSSNSNSNNNNEKHCVRFVDSSCQTDNNFDCIDIGVKQMEENENETSSLACNNNNNNDSSENNEILDVVSVNEEIIENPLPILRPLRKRKKTFDKPKVGLKNKKSVSTTL